ncbi:hypothetical protein BKA93DRAFT_827384 [Sparassis latifolia]
MPQDATRSVVYIFRRPASNTSPTPYWNVYRRPASEVCGSWPVPVLHCVVAHDMSQEATRGIVYIFRRPTSNAPPTPYRSHTPPSGERGVWVVASIRAALCGCARHVPGCDARRRLHISSSREQHATDAILKPYPAVRRARRGDRWLRKSLLIVLRLSRSPPYAKARHRPLISPSRELAVLVVALRPPHIGIWRGFYAIVVELEMALASVPHRAANCAGSHGEGGGQSTGTRGDVVHGGRTVKRVDV